MMKITNFLLLLLVVKITSVQEKSIKIIDQISHHPIANASIKLNNKFGYSTDLQGLANINLKKTDSLFISHVAYHPQKLSFEDVRLTNFIIFLEEKTNVLDEVIVSNKNLSLDSIIAKTKRNMTSMFSKQEPTQKFYVNALEQMNFRNLDIDFESKNTLKSFDEKKFKHAIEAYQNELKSKNSGYTKHFKGIVKRKEIYIKEAKKYFNTFVIDSFKGYKENDAQKIMDFDDLQNKAQNIILAALNENKTYKIKSGLFKIEDSLSVKTLQNKKGTHTYSYFDLQSGIRKAYDLANFYQQEKASNFFDSKYYDLKLTDSNKEYYTILFTPKKSSSKYQGFIKIDKYTFTIKQLKYEYADGKKGESLNLKLLLGVKFSENWHQAELNYQTVGNICYLSNFNEVKKAYFYVNRPIKFIENSKNKAKFKFNFKTEIDKKDVTDVIFSEPKNIQLAKKEISDYKKEYRYLTADELKKSKW